MLNGFTPPHETHKWVNVVSSRRRDYFRERRMVRVRFFGNTAWYFNIFYHHIHIRFVISARFSRERMCDVGGCWDTTNGGPRSLDNYTCKANPCLEWTFQVANFSSLLILGLEIFCTSNFENFRSQIEFVFGWDEKFYTCRVIFEHIEICFFVCVSFFYFIDGTVINIFLSKLFFLCIWI